MADRPALLPAFLADVAGRPFEWGRLDCSLLVAAWLEHALGLHPADDLYGAYDSRLGARRLIVRAGGLAALFAPRLTAVGLVATDRAKAGDVAVVRHGGEYGAIRAASGWAVKSLQGLVVSEAFSPVMVWSL